MHAFHRLLPLACALALGACGGASTPSGGGATPPAGGTTAAAAPTSFKEMTQEQKVNHMKTVIRPVMGQVFTEYDAKKYGDFGCGTCHGERKEDPHKVLPRLTLSGDGFQKLSAEKPALMKFMGEKVTPAMAKAMGEAPFDPATRKGFGCGGCHTVQ
jgi:hypothetical protein